MSLNTSVGENIFTPLLDLPLNPRLALLFPGQGSQRVGMGKDVVDAFANAKISFEIGSRSLACDLTSICFKGPEERLTETANAQPAILTTSAAYLAAALAGGAIRERPALLAGHSLGQYTALVAAGSLNLAGAVTLVRERGRLMGEAGRVNPGTMAAALGLDEDAVEQICAETGAEPANYNGPTQIVIGGTPKAIEAASVLVKERGGKVLPVKVAGAFHTSLMASAGEEFAVRLRETAFSDARIPVVSNVTALTITRASEIRHDLAEQVARPVQWNRTIEFMLAAGVDTFIEIGPGRLLSGMLKRIAPGAQVINIDNAEALAAATNV
jgi:[acyl-carrier-protein] S-malonyltransferase